jgi:hypothetical protein
VSPFVIGEILALCGFLACALYVRYRGRNWLYYVLKYAGMVATVGLAMISGYRVIRG